MAHGDHEAAPDEEVRFPERDAALHKLGGPADHEQAVTVAFELGSLVRGLGVLDGERVKLEDALKDWARTRGPIPTSAGKAWGPSTRRQSTFKKDLAIALLRQLGATEEQIAALTYQSEIATFTERRTAKAAS